MRRPVPGLCASGVRENWWGPAPWVALRAPMVPRERAVSCGQLERWAAAPHDSHGALPRRAQRAAIWRSRRRAAGSPWVAPPGRSEAGTRTPASLSASQAPCWILGSSLLCSRCGNRCRASRQLVGLRWGCSQPLPAQHASSISQTRCWNSCLHLCVEEGRAGQRPGHAGAAQARGSLPALQRRRCRRASKQRGSAAGRVQPREGLGGLPRRGAARRSRRRAAFPCGASWAALRRRRPLPPCLPGLWFLLVLSSGAWRLPGGAPPHSC